MFLMCRHFYLPKSQTLHTLKWVWRVGECKMQITSESRHMKQFRTQSGKKKSFQTRNFTPKHPVLSDPQET